MNKAHCAILAQEFANQGMNITAQGLLKVDPAWIKENPICAAALAAMARIEKAKRQERQR